MDTQYGDNDKYRHHNDTYQARFDTNTLKMDAYGPYKDTHSLTSNNHCSMGGTYGHD